MNNGFNFVLLVVSGTVVTVNLNMTLVYWTHQLCDVLLTVFVGHSSGGQPVPF